MRYTTLIDAPALRALAGDSHVAIVDCRFDLARPEAGREAFLAGHIPAASHADLGRDLSGPIGPATGRHPLPDPQEFAARLGSWGVDNDSQVIAYDAGNGAFAARLWWMLRWLGHRQAAVLDGGLDAWTGAGGTLQAGDGAPAARRFVAHADADAWVSTAQVVRGLAQRAYLLVDARAPERYAGAVEPLDSVAGHVPGAVNHPFGANLGPGGHFLDAEQLRRRWLARLDARAPAEVVAMCGSGVTACQNLLALEVAGLHGARLYAGSWSEWIRDPARPVARGGEPSDSRNYS